jgi:hypothetical protein
MHADIATRRRLLLLTYQRYLAADRVWDLALREMKTWFPTASQPGPSTIGNPGSPIRRLYRQRERAMLQLETARLKLEVAKQRLATSRQKTQATRVLYITYAGQ